MKMIRTLKNFEAFMNAMEVAAIKRVLCCGCKVLAAGCKVVARVYLCKERDADSNRALHKAVDYRMAYATWTQRANHFDREARS
jgi:hypothetical protein